MYWPSTFSINGNVNQSISFQTRHTLGGLQSAIHNGARRGYNALRANLARRFVCAIQAKTLLEMQALSPLLSYLIFDPAVAICDS